MTTNQVLSFPRQKEAMPRYCCECFRNNQQSLLFGYKVKVGSRQSAQKCLGESSGALGARA